MNIGDRIIGKRTGTLTPSTITGIMTWNTYFGIVGSSQKESALEVWSKFYSDVENKLVIISEFDEPTCPISFSEYKASVDERTDDFTVKLRENTELYLQLIQDRYNQFPKAKSVSYPEDDVEILDSVLSK
jgi:hypothetical protein